MSITLFKTNCGGALAARSLCGLFVASSLVLACSGSDSEDPGADSSDDDAAPSMPPPVSMPDRVSIPPRDEPSSQASGTDENGPDVTGIDESTATGQGANEEEDVEAASVSTPTDALVPIDAVPDSDLCAAVADWDPAWVQFEEDVLLLVNEVRSQPTDCGLAGQFEPAAPLQMDPILRCSSRLHSVDMFERDYFEHDTPDGVTPVERMAAAGFEGGLFGENIAQGQRTPEEVMLAWMDSDGHCENIMRAEYTLIGIGYSPGAPVRQGKSDFWTQNFGAPFANRTRR